MPRYHDMATVFREKMWLAEPETRDYFAALIEFIYVWEKILNDRLPRDVAPAIGHTEQNLAPFYQHVVLCRRGGAGRPPYNSGIEEDTCDIRECTGCARLVLDTQGLAKSRRCARAWGSHRHSHARKRSNHHVLRGRGNGGGILLHSLS